MSKNRIVNCTVINNTGYDLSLIDYGGSEGGVFDGVHGSYTQYPTNTLPAGQTKKAFSIEKASGFYGSTGWVSYSLKNSQGQIVLMFNNPYDYEGEYRNGNCWFYAAIQGLSSGSMEPPFPVGQAINVYALVSGFTINVKDPQNQDTMNITVTINQA
ncbi:MAG: hypothetical protein ACRCYO_15445 [Bacteroidia bacterium]